MSEVPNVIGIKEKDVKNPLGLLVQRRMAIEGNMGWVRTRNWIRRKQRNYVVLKKVRLIPFSLA
jgi:hypothetical protein